MKPIYLISALIIALLLSGCRSHRRVVRGSDGVDLGTVPEAGVAPQYSGRADNSVTSTLMEEAFSWLGTPYKYGGNDKQGADCSGFVMVVFRDALGIDLPRVSREQGEYCKRINKRDLFPGDLLFYVTGSSGRVSHVGIYIGDGKMIHASSSKGVIVTDITKPYYINHFHHYGRVQEYYKMLPK